MTVGWRVDGHRVTARPKPGLGAAYHTGAVADAVAHADLILECTGVGELVLENAWCSACLPSDKGERSVGTQG